ncbi:MAG: hypothetical protein DSZ06_04865 [Sulfurospirillum sp.]|nr:MAG: hypothetical protein DSZ06_04865 [Sulfurospirillum sp.]
MTGIRFIPAPLQATFDLSLANRDLYEKEFQSMSEYEEDSIGQWLKIAKAKGETKDSDPVLLELIVELHKKIDRLTQIVKNEEKHLLPLPNSANISDIGFEHIKLEEEILEPNQEYYMRISMPLFPKRDMPLFIEAISKDVAKIVQIHEKDERDWNAYVTARERVMIRQMKGKNV